MRCTLFLSLFILSYISSEAQYKYASVERSYNIEVKLEEDSLVNFDYRVDFHETDTTAHAVYETSSLDTFLFLLSSDIEKVPDDKRNLLFYIHGFMGGQSMNLRFTKYDLIEKYILPESSDISRLISIRWPGNMPVYKTSKANSVKVAPAVSKQLVQLMNELQSRTEGGPIQYDILNHSLGCEFFKEVVQHFPDEPVQYFDQILLCAPDLDIDVFSRNGSLCDLQKYCNRTTVYFSNKDLTLGFSRELNKKGRLGLDGPHLETQFHDKLVFVEMSHVMDEKLLPMRLTGHSYYRGSTVAGNDILQTLIGLPADQIEARKKSEQGPQFFKLFSEEQ